jgi:hypothetical protein
MLVQRRTELLIKVWSLLEQLLLEQNVSRHGFLIRKMYGYVV